MNEMLRDYIKETIRIGFKRMYTVDELTDAILVALRDKERRDMNLRTAIERISQVVAFHQLAQIGTGDEATNKAWESIKTELELNKRKEGRKQGKPNQKVSRV